MLDDLNFAAIPDARTRALIIRLLNLVEDLSADLRAAISTIVFVATSRSPRWRTS